MDAQAALQELNILIASGERWMKQAYRVREKLAGDSSPASARTQPLSAEEEANILSKRRMVRGKAASSRIQK